MGARIPNVKPGKATIEYLTKIQASTRFWGGLLLSVLATTSTILDHYLRRINEGFAIGFTSVLIIVGSIIELRRSYQAYNVMPSLSKALRRILQDISLEFDTLQTEYKELAARALILKGAGSISYPGPTKLFLLVKAPASFNLPPFSSKTFVVRNEEGVGSIIQDHLVSMSPCSQGPHIQDPN
ncbi:hypothetical protein NC653_005566 [Populus alba x Populus x berolinensis]|uniref:Uncharacterized protein n=1 Tax=Populus alba x Populus x berolinensis TaxID=444605 RepID=A0AAD6WC09_9ROSI|nr:hypothetical protein NC653_005566 [Populus alba x Populus x berolinensis]